MVHKGVDSELRYSTAPLCLRTDFVSCARMARQIAPLTKSRESTWAQSPDPVQLRWSYPFWTTAVVLLGVLFWAYAKHFDNQFEFDDDHCIVRNGALDTMNIGKFMTDPSTYSVLPQNQAWRPGITILNSIDTIRSGGQPDPHAFHTHIFASYILLGVLLFFMFLYLLRKVFPGSPITHYVALLATGLFMLHTANAETINYIIARSDSQSTLFIVLGMVMFMYSDICRKYFLYIIPMAIGFMIKESAIMLAPILVVYVWLFESSLKKHLPGFILTFTVAGLLYFISRKMTPPTWVSGGTDAFLYLCTETFVVIHYVYTFILPVQLSADTDWTYVTTPYDTKVFVGVVFIAFAFWLAWRCSKKQETKLISFGIAWFFLALAPTSSIVPFSEVLNDHRIFFPFIGLVLIVANCAMLIYRRYEETSLRRTVVVSMLIAASGLLTAHAIGTRKRCEVWDTNETLWRDVTVKSPNNARGWMNYGLALMERGYIDSAVTLFNKTLSVSPNYVYAHINMGVAQARLGHDAEAEGHYTYALQLDPGNPEIYYFYGDFLIRKQRVKEGIALLEQGHTLSPAHAGINSLLSQWNNKNLVTPLQAAIEAADKNPTAENLVALSLAWYNAGEYLQCAKTAERATQLKPDFGYAWNNICAAYNKIGEFDKAVDAGEKAVKYLPNDELTMNNLKYAQQQKLHFDQLLDAVKANPDYNSWLSLSLEWYNAGNFAKCIEAAEQATKINPNDAASWNNICAAANKLGDYEKGIDAGEKAVKLDPSNERAKNNLAESKRLKDAAGK